MNHHIVWSPPLSLDWHAIVEHADLHPMTVWYSKFCGFLVKHSFDVICTESSQGITSCGEYKGSLGTTSTAPM